MRLQEYSQGSRVEYGGIESTRFATAESELNIYLIDGLMFKFSYIYRCILIESDTDHLYKIFYFLKHKKKISESRTYSLEYLRELVTKNIDLVTLATEGFLLVR